MLDIQLIRDKKKVVEKALLKRMAKADLDLDVLIKLDDQRRELIVKNDELKAQRNQASKTKPDAKTIVAMKKTGEEIKKLDTKLADVEAELHLKLSELPNLPADDVVAGGKENNKVLATFGQKPDFKFKILISCYFLSSSVLF